MSIVCFLFFFFFNDTATTEIYTLSLHDALPICRLDWEARRRRGKFRLYLTPSGGGGSAGLRGTSVAGGTSSTTVSSRSEEHTSELQSRQYLVCRLLLEKKK